MVTIRVFDPPMCCSTGVCGPAIDPELARFAADLDWLASQGVVVERHNLAQHPEAFVGQTKIRDALEQRGEGCLPIVLRGDEVMSEGLRPSREQLAEWAGVSAPERIIFTPKVRGVDRKRSWGDSPSELTNFSLPANEKECRPGGDLAPDSPPEKPRDCC